MWKAWSRRWMHCVRKSQQQGEVKMANGEQNGICRRGNEMPHTTSENDICTNFMDIICSQFPEMFSEGRQTGEKMERG